MTFPAEAIRPVEIREVGETELLIVWQDDHRSLFAFPYLRRRCRCAACVDERTGAPRLVPEKVSEAVKPLKIRPVGNYAIRFDWSDGHSTGIYAFEYLRSICPCEGCRSA